MTSVELRPKCIRTSLLLAILTKISHALSQSDLTGGPEIVTDRPDVTESSIVVPIASLQIENGIIWSNDHGSQTFDLSESLIRFGVSRRTEIRIAVPNYLGGISGPGATGFGDIALGMKQTDRAAAGRI